jgi:hypothetical protein
MQSFCKNSQIECFPTRVDTDSFTCFGMWNSCSKFVSTFNYILYITTIKINNEVRHKYKVNYIAETIYIYSTKWKISQVYRKILLLRIPEVTDTGYPELPRGSPQLRQCRKNTNISYKWISPISHLLF